MVPNTLHLLLGDFIGDDWQALIQLHCIAINDFAIEFSGYLNSQLSSVINNCFECFLSR